jgi:hypothetical protein
MKRIVPLFAIILAFLFLYASLSLAQVNLQMRVIRASNVGQSVDPSIKDVYAELGSLFSFTSYKLLRENSFNLSLNQPVSYSPRPGILTEVTLVGRHGSAAELKIRVVREGRDTLNTLVRLFPGRTVLVGGPRLREGVIIYALSAKF